MTARSTLSADSCSTPPGDEPARPDRVLGSGFTLADLSTVTGRSAGDVSGALSESFRAQIFVGTDSGLCFRHDLTRDAFYEDLQPEVRPGPAPRGRPTAGHERSTHRADRRASRTRRHRRRRQSGRLAQVVWSWTPTASVNALRSVQGSRPRTSTEPPSGRRVRSTSRPSWSSRHRSVPRCRRSPRDQPQRTRHRPRRCSRRSCADLAPWSLVTRGWLDPCGSLSSCRRSCRQA